MQTKNIKLEWNVIMPDFNNNNANIFSNFKKY